MTPEQRERYSATRRAKYAGDPDERERRKAAARKWRLENPDRKRELNRSYIKANPEKKARWSKNYRDSDRGRQKEQARYQANRDRIIKDQRLKRTGFTEEMRLQLMQAQEGRCAICSADLASLPPRKVHADHCHETNVPRGVLCHYCNAGLGFFRDDIERLEAAIKYLESHRGG
jgi:hypothetical protein